MADEFKDKFIGFVDVLGWKEKVRAAEAGTELCLAELKNMLRDLGNSEDQKEIEDYGPIVCPASGFIRRDLDLLLTQVSDCVIVSSEVSPAGVINLVHHCSRAVMRLLRKGIMCRGYITRGSIHHTDEPAFIGTGYQEALERELTVTAFRTEADERGTPFVEVDPSVCEYVRDCGDSCVKEMFDRMVKGDGTVTALFPFKKLEHSFMICDWRGNKFDPEKERQANETMRGIIERLKQRVMDHVDPNRPDAMRKARHYVAALDAQIRLCLRAEEIISVFDSSFRRG